MLKMNMRHKVPAVDSWGREYIRSMHLEDRKEGWCLRRIYSRIQTDTELLCQVARPIRCIAHMPRSYHAQSSPRETHHSRGCVPPLQTADVSWEIVLELVPKSDTWFQSSHSHRFPLRAVFDTIDRPSTVQIGLIEHLRIPRHQIRILGLRLQFSLDDRKYVSQYIYIYMHYMQRTHLHMHIYVKICFSSLLKLPWIASQSKALASFRNVWFIIVLLAVWPWFVLPPWVFTQNLWLVSGPSQLVFSVFPHLTMSLGTCLMLCIFSVSIIIWSLLFL